jgi:LEA14-like dessication related protein
VKRIVNVIALSFIVLAAACSSGTQISQTAAHIPMPDITVTGRTDLSSNPTVATAVTAHFAFRIVNNADIPITLRRIDIIGLDVAPIRIESRNRPFNTVIDPHSVQSVDFITTATFQDRRASSPVSIRAVALFDSAQGNLQKVVQPILQLELAE